MSHSFWFACGLVTGIEAWWTQRHMRRPYR
jgi:hypothetical protein